MPNILKYGAYGRIDVLQQTADPAEIIGLAARQTQMLEPSLKNRGSNSDIIRFLYEANHTSLFEHAVISFHIRGVSRAFLAQITRHRMASYTSSSQHYTDHSDAPVLLSSDMSKDPRVLSTVDTAYEMYAKLVAEGTPLEEARMVLPQCGMVNLIMTINARSLANFLNLRLCRRNVREMVEVAQNMYQLADEWFPQLFHLVGPDCEQHHTSCRQGKMSCVRR